MKSGARVQAAIDILTAFEEAPRPIERMLKDWGKANRYAGSGDRRTIGQYVYTVMRDRGELAHRMASAAPRSLVIGMLNKTVTEENWKLWFDGSDHAPVPFTDEETAQLSADEIKMPPHVKLNVPEWMVSDVTNTFGPDATVAMAAMAARAPVDLRVNALKSTRLDGHDALAAEDIETGATPYAPLCLRVVEAEKGPRPDIEHSKAYKTGLVEIQDEGSQLAANVAAAKPGEQVIDLCAGAGGKTLALAASMGNHGQIFACDTEGSKLKNLKPRLARAGARNVQVRKIRPFVPAPGEVDPDFNTATDAADLVLLDVPCSGSGTWRRHPDAKWRLTEAALATYCTAQAEILKRGASLVKPGGRLVYITCSILARENEEQVTRFLRQAPDFEQQDIDVSFSGMRIKKGLQMAPHVTGTDGFFVAVMTRNK